MNGQILKNSYLWLSRGGMGCCSQMYARVDDIGVYLCMGYMQEGQIAWKIGLQKLRLGGPVSVMQCDFDIDFEMPEDDKGNVIDTPEYINVDENGEPEGYGTWDNLFEEMKKRAQLVVNTLKGD